MLIPLVDAQFFREIRFIATDMDGTLTQGEKFTPALFQALESLAEAKIEVLVTTGRSAGWVHGVKHYFPVAGAIAENGGVFYAHDSDIPQMLTPITDISQHRQKLAAMFDQLREQFPQLQEAEDNRFRLTDWTFSVAGLGDRDLQTLAKICQQEGWGFTYSTVQCHIKPLAQDKATGLQVVLDRHFPQITPQQLVTIGDSPNDESLFDRDRFPHSVGVANVLPYRDILTHCPTYITTLPECAGFCELVSLLVKK
ncbi:HAD family hydrolase [Spirulina sp. 06S082]|uniref:HAD family hydrolase n=1 Tax=Spirulina sp. 06S082 TaxID=3110248 RepID=UPI002B1ECD90|nr:HAD family hydrolase [Spirulina sp. 06S082]MEA5470324.1 HAD family hydrolase [Spirulina sp. 06S082]